jgi:hypothetical protein
MKTRPALLLELERFLGLTCLFFRATNSKESSSSSFGLGGTCSMKGDRCGSGLGSKTLLETQLQYRVSSCYPENVTLFSEEKLLAA